MKNMEGIEKLNIGCGGDIHKDMINLDKGDLPGVDIIHDLTSRWPFKDGQMTEIHANHILEHLPDQIFVMNEAYRCLIGRGVFHIEVPWWAGEWARGDPTHVHFFDHNSFAPFSDWWPQYKHLGIAGPWIKVSQTYRFNTEAGAKGFLDKMGFSSCQAMIVELRKPQGV